MEYKYRAECLACGYSERVSKSSKEECKEIDVCPKCNGAFVDTWYKHKYSTNQSNEIEIVMGSANKPPKVILNGKDIQGIISLDYKYVTKSVEPGYHNFTVQYHDDETMTIRTISAKKVFEGNKSR